MPIYEYKCGACGAVTDALQKISDPPLEICPSCGASALKRLISAPSFRLKGGGWYETDFKSDGDKKRNLAESESKPAEKSESSGDAKKSETKTDKKETKTAAAKKPAADSSSE